MPSAFRWRQQPLVGLLVGAQRLREAVLAVEDVADVDVEPGQPELVALRG